MSAIPRAEWKWFGHNGHLIVGQWCRFHLCTQVGPWMVSTVGEYWPERSTREIHASVYDPAWLAKNKSRRGDDFDYAYMKHFGYEEIGCGRKYETMVFRAGAPCNADECGRCGMPIPADFAELNYAPYNDAGSATRGHMEMCEKYAATEPQP